MRRERYFHRDEEEERSIDIENGPLLHSILSGGPSPEEVRRIEEAVKESQEQSDE